MSSPRRSWPDGCVGRVCGTGASLRLTRMNVTGEDRLWFDGDGSLQFRDASVQRILCVLREHLGLLIARFEYAERTESGDYRIWQESGVRIGTRTASGDVEYTNPPRALSGVNVLWRKVSLLCHLLRFESLPPEAQKKLMAGDFDPRLPPSVRVNLIPLDDVLRELDRLSMLTRWHEYETDNQRGVIPLALVDNVRKLSKELELHEVAIGRNEAAQADSRHERLGSTPEAVSITVTQKIAQGGEKARVEYSLEEEDRPKLIRLIVILRGASGEEVSRSTVRGQTSARLAQMVLADPDQDHTWVELLRAGLALGYWRNSSPQNLARTGRRVRRELSPPLRGCWNQGGSGVRWQSP